LRQSEGTQLGLLLLGSRPLERLISIAVRAEACGFDYVVVPDERFYRDVYVVSTALALHTERIGLGPCVTDPYSRRPELTATAMAALDEVSSGRALLGIGAGVSGFRELGIVRQPPPVVAVRDAVTSIRAMLGGTSATAVSLNFQPYRSGVPIYIAAEGPRMLGLAGELSDAVILQAKVTEALFTASMSHVRAGMDRAKRAPSDVAVVARVDVSVAANAATARTALRRTAVRRLFGAARNWDLLTESGVVIPAALRDALGQASYMQDSAALNHLAELVTDDIVDALCIAVGDGDLAGRLDGLVRMGATQILVNPVAVDDGIEAVLEEAGNWRSSMR
jgi:5,10-methylenetetrahydromethanopterin reductase